MKSLMSLWSCMAHEMAIRCCTSATRDINTVSCRTEHEGLWFLAVVLADFGKAIEKWLDQGHVGPSSDVPKFSWDRRAGRPRFLGGFLDRVFNPCDGVLLDEPCIEAIIALRQLTLMFSKIALPERDSLRARSLVGQRTKAWSNHESEAMLSFIKCEQDVRKSDSATSSVQYAEFARMSDLLFSSVFTAVDRDVYNLDLLPKHGPGAVADRLSSNGKYDQRTWTSRLEDTIPFLEYCLPSWSYYDQLDSVDILEPGAEIPVRVISVPKTLKTPRIIAIEPTAMQYSQQALSAKLVSALEGDSFLSKVIGFSDQRPNQSMAREGSLTGKLATLDLSDASDRVSYQLVRVMLRNHPHLLAAVDASRSRRADVPGHGVTRLAKYASMGSALCFPVEAMVFTTLAFLGIADELSTTPRRGSLMKEFHDKVRVYGDDIVVPARHVLSVVKRLEAFGSQVNLSKSFWIGRFRESCGREYFDGHDVSIVKVRQVFATQRQNAGGVISMISLRNQLYWSGYWKTCRWLDELIGRLIKCYPTVLPTSPLLGRESCLGYQFEKLDPYTHSPIAKGYYVSAEPPSDPLEGPGALLKCFHLAKRRETCLPPFMRGETEDTRARFGPVLPTLAVKHLERSGRPKHVSIKLGWRSPF